MENITDGINLIHTFFPDIITFSLKCLNKVVLGREGEGFFLIVQHSYLLAKLR